MNQQVYERRRAEQATEREQPTANEAHRAPSYAADQGALWNKISARQARASVHSPTAALHDVYEGEAVDLASFVGAFPCPAGASGLAVGIGGRLVALELFDSSATLAGQWPRLVEGAASAYFDHRRAVIAGLEPALHHRYPDEGALERLIGRAEAALGDAVVGPSVGEGLDVRLRGAKVHGQLSSSPTIRSTWNCSALRGDREVRASERGFTRPGTRSHSRRISAQRAAAARPALPGPTQWSSNMSEDVGDATLGAIRCAAW